MAINSKSQTTIEGLDDLLKAFKRLPEDARAELEVGADETGKLILQKAKQLVPVKSGNLQKSLKSRKGSKSGKNKSLIFRNVTFDPKKAGYGSPLEMGHKTKSGKTVPARPFLRPAADQSKEEVIEIMAKHLNNALDKWGK